jgi:hypothetical protein
VFVDGLNMARGESSDSVPDDSAIQRRSFEDFSAAADTMRRSFMKTKTAAQWKRFYAEERDRLGEVGLAQRLDAAPEVAPPTSQAALVFPHTMAAVSGELIAAVARAVVRARASEVLALGVLHGAREQDAEMVRRARAGDRDALATLRRIHDGSAPWCAEEFSLDAFVVFLRLAAQREGRNPPQVIARYPFLVGDDPASVPGLDEVAELAGRMPVVATTDPIHHGAGYGTPEAERASERDATTVASTRACIEKQLALLAAGSFGAFADLAARVRSDFRDNGPVLAHLMRLNAQPSGEVLALRLVDYSEVLGAEVPTWVAAPLIRFGSTQ